MTSKPTTGEPNLDPIFKSKLQVIKLLALDFDGVLTDGRVYTNEEGIEMVRSSRRDSMGIGILEKNGVEVVVISTEANPVVSARCSKIKVPCFQRVDKTEGKAEILRRVMAEKNLASAQVAYVGDDVNDLAVLKVAGVRLTVADGHPKVQAVCDYVATRKGGDHAVREICDLILEAQGKEIAWH